MRAETTFELTWDPEVEAGGWLRLPRDAIEGDAFPRARIGDLLERGRRRGIASAAGWLAGTVYGRVTRLLRGASWPLRT